MKDFSASSIYVKKSGIWTKASEYYIKKNGIWTIASDNTAILAIQANQTLYDTIFDEIYTPDTPISKTYSVLFANGLSYKGFRGSLIETRNTINNATYDFLNSFFYSGNTITSGLYGGSGVFCNLALQLGDLITTTYKNLGIYADTSYFGIGEMVYSYSGYSTGGIIYIENSIFFFEKTNYLLYLNGKSIRFKNCIIITNTTKNYVNRGSVSYTNCLIETPSTAEGIDIKARMENIKNGIETFSAVKKDLLLQYLNIQ